MKFFGRKLPLVSAVLAGALIIRLANLSWPFFTVEEARLSYRGFVLANTGRDEFGREMPLLFNSLTDYQLPVTSYLTAVGIKIVGKSDLGARLPYILIGVLLVYLTFQLCHLFTKEPKVKLMTALSVAFSPTLIYLSKIPNQTIILTFIFVMLFLLLLRAQKNLFFIGLVMLSGILTSKSAWFILPFFTCFTVFLFDTLEKTSMKLKIAALSLVVCVAALTLFLFVPQSKRSLQENNFPLFQDITVQNALNRLRGQGVEQGWPNFVEKILFNKTAFITVGLAHWLDNISPAIYFSQIDSDAKYNLNHSGIFPAIMIFPAVLGLVRFLRERQQRKFLLLPLVLTFPAAFVYPDFSPQLVVLTVPFVAVIVGVGLSILNKYLLTVVLFLMLISVAMESLFLEGAIKQVNNSRPIWILPIAKNISAQHELQSFVSDDIVEDFLPFYEWLTPADAREGYIEIPSPYRYRQSDFGNVKVLGSQAAFFLCPGAEGADYYLSPRDFTKAQILLGLSKEGAVRYKDSLGEERAYYLPRQNNLCLR